MKKIFVVILTLILSFALVACGEDKKPQKDGTKKPAATYTAGNTAGADKTADPAGSFATVTLYNQTEIDFVSVAISKAGKKEWGENLISGTIKAMGGNTEVKIAIPTDKENAQYDVLATDASGKTYEFHYMDLSELTEKGGTIGLALTEGGDGFAMFNPPYVDPTLTIDSVPTKLTYKVGEEYDPAGFAATYTYETGETYELTADDVEFIVSGNVEIYAGRPFTQAGKKVVVVHYAGLTAQFELTVE